VLPGVFLTQTIACHLQGIHVGTSACTCCRIVTPDAGCTGAHQGLPLTLLLLPLLPDVLVGVRPCTAPAAADAAAAAATLQV
jgi:hypothetical protein